MGEAQRRERNTLDRRHFNAYVWKAALAAAGVEPTRANGMHARRDFFASVLLDAGESIEALSEYLGHSDPVSPRGPTPTCCRPVSSGRGKPSTAHSQVLKRRPTA